MRHSCQNDTLICHNDKHEGLRKNEGLAYSHRPGPPVVTFDCITPVADYIFFLPQYDSRRPKYPIPLCGIASIRYLYFFEPLQFSKMIAPQGDKAGWKLVR